MEPSSISIDKKSISVGPSSTSIDKTMCHRRLLLLLIFLSLSQIVLARRQRSSSIDESTPPRQRTGGGIGAHNPTHNDPKKRRRKRRRPKLPRETRKLIKTKTKEAIRLAKQNHLRGAAKIFEEIVDMSPKDAQYLNNLAVTYMRMKLYHLAEQVLRRARRANPEDTAISKSVIIWINRL